MKIRAYCTGLLRHTETGVTPGQFNPGDGHRLLPRYPGDPLGAVTGDVRVGRPEDDGWSWGVTPKEWRDILLKCWLPRDFTPDGWSWNDEPEGWGWDQILDAASTPPEQDTGRSAADDEQRPFSGLIRWSDHTHRNLLHCGSATKGGDRYQWRREPHSASRRDSNGNLYRMASTDGDAVSSWSVQKFHRTWATLAQRALTELIADDPTLTLSLHPESSLSSGATSAMPTTADVAQAAREAQARALREAITELTADVGALLLAAARKLSQGDEHGADSYETQAEAKKQELADTKQELKALLAAPVPVAAPPPLPTADFGRPAAVIAALTGPFATGPAPKALREALRAMGGAETRLYVVDATTVRMKVEVSVRRTDGTLASATSWGTMRRSCPNLNTDAARERRKQAKADLARKWFYEGLPLEELTKLSGASPLHTHRIVREQLATGSPREVGQAPLGSLAAERIPREGLRGAITMHPVAEARACVWSALNPADPAPSHVHARYPALIEQTYRQAEHAWDPRSVMRDPRGDGRVDVLTVLRHRPDPTAPIASERLADLVGVPVRHVNAISASGSRAQTPTPRSLQRVGDWGGYGSSNLPMERRTVTLLACPWHDCDSATADAVLLLPEIVIGAGTSVVCRACLRPPTRNVALPDSYRAVLVDVEARTGTWVQCTAPGCTTDLGAGSGVLWRWDDTPAHRVDAHPACMPASQRPPSNADIRLWAIRHGHAVTDRGRIPAALREAHETHRSRQDVP